MSRPECMCKESASQASQSLAGLPLSPPAIRFLVDMYGLLQAWDDFYDGDDMPQSEKLSAIWASLVGIPSNPFYAANSGDFIPLLASLVVRWESANQLEAMRERLDIAFVWRAAFFDLVLHCLLIEHGPRFAMENGPSVARLYSETFETFTKEFEHA
ncbi:hypothetical protein NMQ14_03290 [Methyloversatilis sp. XJ19-13]|uniref:hypothetical protein n=1 Tax=Methyloversatilis sp. XJ19-13 TaxID=2963430 RepID=UPI00211D137E|nr:hypothetical protein [Methyloversatilis sp. XJ19-13]MCQ9373269.1 hypothetical protein [Methyloversatilis sp. XJ19-13]